MNGAKVTPTGEEELRMFLSALLFIGLRRDDYTNPIDQLSDAMKLCDRLIYKTKYGDA